MSVVHDGMGWDGSPDVKRPGKEQNTAGFGAISGTVTDWRPVWWWESSRCEDPTRDEFIQTKPSTSEGERRPYQQAFSLTKGSENDGSPRGELGSG